MHIVALGDFAQHQPVKGRALFYGANKLDYLDCHSLEYINATTGRRLWMSFEECVILKEQHRFGSDPDGKALYDIVCKLTHSRNVDGSLLTYEDVSTLADTINNQAINPANLPSFLERGPKAVVLRHSIRPLLTKMLVLHHAAKANSRVCLWRASDRAFDGRNGEKSIVLELHRSMSN